LLLSGCSKAASSASSALSGAASSASASFALSDACSLLTKDQVAQATGDSVDVTKSASSGSTKACTFLSISGSSIVLSVGTSPAGGITSDIPGLGNVMSAHQMTKVSGIGDQAYAGSDSLLASKGSTFIFLLDINLNGGNHQQALETLARDVLAKV